MATIVIRGIEYHILDSDLHDFLKSHLPDPKLQSPSQLSQPKPDDPK